MKTLIESLLTQKESRGKSLDAANVAIEGAYVPWDS